MRVAVLLAALSLVLPLARPARAAEDATFSVLKITLGEEITFKALAAGEVGAEQKRIQKEAKETHEKWQGERDAFYADKANIKSKKVFRDPEPPKSASVTVAKGGFATQADAQADADERQKKADGKYAVVRTTTSDGSVNNEILLQRKIKGRELELQTEYDTALEKWETGKQNWYNDPANRDAQNPHPYTAVKPTKPKVERLKEDLPDQAAAQKFLDELPPAKK